MLFCILAITFSTSGPKLDRLPDCYDSYAQCWQAVPSVARRQPAPVANHPEAYRCVKQ